MEVIGLFVRSVCPVGVCRQLNCRRLITWVLTVALSFSLLAAAQENTGNDAEDEGGVMDWKLVWSQEFEDGEIDPAVWNFDIGNGHAQGIPGWGNAELQFYTDRNAFVEDGRLVIEAREEAARDEYGTYRFTSARLTTQNKFTMKYGKIEIRAKLPEGQGIWPALWMLGSNIGEAGWPVCGEIDIMEFLGHDTRTVYGHVHGPGYSGGASIGTGYTLPEDAPSFSQEFHVFSIEWDEDEIRWHVDGERYFAFSKDTLDRKNREWFEQQGIEGAHQQTQIYRWVFDQEFFLLVNVAVGGHWPGYPDENTQFPQRMYIDHIRVYERAIGEQHEADADQK